MVISIGHLAVVMIYLWGVILFLHKRILKLFQRFIDKNVIKYYKSLTPLTEIEFPYEKKRFFKKIKALEGFIYYS